MKENFSTIKEFFTMLREAIIVLLFLFLILWPSAFKKQLSKIGFNQFNFMGMNLDLKQQFKETVQTGSQVADLKSQMDTLKTIIDSLSSISVDPVQKEQLNEISQKTQKIFSSTTKLDNQLKQQMSVQQTALVEESNVKLPDEGWIYGGKLTENKLQWDLSVTPTIAERITNFETGNELTIIDDVYLRTASSPLSHAKAPIISVIKKGEKVTFLDKDFSHSIGGGWFIWLKVRRNG